MVLEVKDCTASALYMPYVLQLVQTLRFGDYEATADVVLWEVDPDYRRRAKDKERAHAAGFGPSLRRLRKQRGLSQSDFPNVARKTISRIEKGEIGKPRAATLRRIAKALGVAPDQIETY
jgi:DNA-binding XRE family transcriptional regulator